MVRACLLSIAWMAIAACGPSDPPVAPTTAAPSALPTASSEPAASMAPSHPAGDADDACSIDADCAVVELACCDHCNGGKVGAFHASRVAAHKPTGCAGQRCTRRACGKATAKCVEKRCTVEMEDVQTPKVP